MDSNDLPITHSSTIERTDSNHPSLLGIPTEIRLQIYTHLLLPSPGPPTNQPPTHCCAFPHHAKNYNRYNRDDSIQDVACDCHTHNLHPAILRVCHKTHAEARQILWEGMELLVRMPYLFSFLDTPLETLLTSLPPYAAGCVRQLAIVGTPGEASEPRRHPKTHKWYFPLQLYAATLAARLPKLERVRLHIDFGSGQSGRRTVVEAFSFLVDVPTVQGVEVFVHGDGMPVWTQRMRGMVCEGLRGRAEALGREVEVREVVGEGEEGGELAGLNWS